MAFGGVEMGRHMAAEADMATPMMTVGKDGYEQGGCGGVGYEVRQEIADESRNGNDDDGAPLVERDALNGAVGQSRTVHAKAEGKTSGKSQEDSAAKDLTIGGKSYKVGDTVVCTYFLEVPENMVNFQGKVTYDSGMLEKTNAYLVEPANYGALLNKDIDGKVVFNGSMLSGYDFTSPGYEFLVVEYKVLKTGTTEPSIDFDVITGTSDKSYAGSNGALSGGANVWAVYS